MVERRQTDMFLPLKKGSTFYTQITQQGIPTILTTNGT